MIYVTGGGAWAKIDASEFLVGALNTGHEESNTRGGWTVRGSIEYALRRPRSVCRFSSDLSYQQGRWRGGLDLRRWRA